jgi:hypothetical protein
MNVFLRCWVNSAQVSWVNIFRVSQGVKNTFLEHNILRTCRNKPNGSYEIIHIKRVTNIAWRIMSKHYIALFQAFD